MKRFTINENFLNKAVQLLVQITFGMLVLIALFGCNGGGGGGSDDGGKDKAPPRIFKVNQHKVYAVETGCFDHYYYNMDYNVVDTAKSCGYAVAGYNDDVVVDWGYTYFMEIELMNSSSNTRYMKLEVWDENNTFVYDGIYERIINGQPKVIAVIPNDAIFYMDDSDIGKTYTVDLWMVDADGKESSVYSFDFFFVD